MSEYTNGRRRIIPRSPKLNADGYRIRINWRECTYSLMVTLGLIGFGLTVLYR